MPDTEEQTPEQAEKEAIEHIKEEAEERSAPSGSVVYEAISKEGVDELDRPTSALAWSGLAAGMSMGFSLVTEGLLRTYLPDAHWRPLVAKFGYSMGFLMVILGRQQLFTENTLTVILPLLKDRKMSIFWNVARLWAVVLAANVLGALIFAAVISHTTAFDPDVKNTFAELGREAMSASFWTVMLRGIFAGWLIALMVWLLPFAESFRVLVIILVTYLVALGKFTHVVAGSVDTLYIVCRGEVSVGHWLAGFFVPVFLGNVLGGVPLVAMINHAQIMAGKPVHDA
ncbi:MAG TPA: formate/nitrite transporter family protein [Tepidisphaeraceae bacterium]|nr:formate/nitrite transporter family protein [Tepidisphaeraceae bacterium]